MKSNLTKDNIAKSLGVSIKDNEFTYYQIIRDFLKTIPKTMVGVFL